MTIAELTRQIHLKKSFLCIGLDTDLEKIPAHLKQEQDAIFAFNKAIIDATHHLCVAFKPNVAFYEAYGISGWRALEKTVGYLNTNYPEIFTIADAKRGDIGNTSSRYARAFFEVMNFDAITVSPYMGRDSIEPFLAFRNKYTILLALTSNSGAADFQMDPRSAPLYMKVLKTSKSYVNAENLMFVTGATQAEHLREIRKIVPDHFLLVPGLGEQGGCLEEVVKHGMNDKVGLLVNASRSIIYSSNGVDFAAAAKSQAMEIQAQMSLYL